MAPFWKENQLDWPPQKKTKNKKQKKALKKESSWFEDSTCKLGSKATTQGFNLLQIESKLVLTNLDFGPPN